MTALAASAPQTGDAPEVTRLIAAQMEDWLNWPPPTEQDVRESWRKLNLQRYARIVRADGELVGYGAVTAVDASRTRLGLELWTRPAPGRADVERLLVAELEPSIDARAARTPRGVVVRSLVERRQAGVRDALAEAGYRVVKHPVRALAELDDAPPQPEWPDGVRVRTFTPGDERAVYELHVETLADAFNLDRGSFDDWLGATVRSPGFDPGLWFLAEDGGELVGITLAHVSANDPTLGWWDVVGVRRSSRRRGLGLALTRQTAAEFWRRGIRRVGCATDTDNPTGAIRVFLAAGYRVVQEWAMYEKALEPGAVRRVVLRSSARSRRLLARLRPR